MEYAILLTVVGLGLCFSTGHGRNVVSQTADDRNVIVGHVVDPEVYMNVSELIRSKGYVCEDHEVITPDRYILQIQRIPGPRNQRGKKQYSSKRPVVLLQHGLLSSSADWVSNLANQSPGFVLADAGFDVWLGNSRGNTYGLKHETLNPDTDEFWNFTWDEMALYDLPATVDKVLRVTGQSSLTYIGHSQGTQIAFAALSQNKTLAAQIKLFIALAPVAFIGHLKSPVRLLAPYANDIDFLLSVLGIHDFLPSNSITRWLAKNLCGYKLPDLLCENVLFVFGGYDFKHMNASRIPVYVGHSPAGTSTKNVIHYAQAYDSGKFQKFDYGPEGNIAHYNQTTPPQYNPKNIKVPVALYSGGADWLAVPRDIAMLKTRLRTIVRDKVINDWEHLDFLWATNAPDACFDDIIGLIKSFYNVV